MAQARAWCDGHIIDDQPAFVHAVRVARAITRHAPDAPPWLLAAALLHDSPDFAPPDLDLATHLGVTFQPDVARVVLALYAHHAAMDLPNPTVHIEDPHILLAATADMTVAFNSLLYRACRTGDPVGFFATRTGLRRLMPYFHACCLDAKGRVPSTLTLELAGLLVAVDDLMAG